MHVSALRGGGHSNLGCRFQATKFATVVSITMGSNTLIKISASPQDVGHGRNGYTKR